MAVRRLGDWCGGEAGRVWYVSYGSNTRAARLRAYVEGGRAPGGGALAHPGCRDPAPPAGECALELVGRLYFATESLVWGGGRAFYEPGVPGRVLARAYDLGREQFRDVAAQEMYRGPGEGPALDEVLAGGVRRVRCGPGRYETLWCLGALDGRPALTFTAPWAYEEAEPVPPAPAYLRTIAAGLGEAGGGAAWSAPEIDRYLAGAALGARDRGTRDP